MTIGLKQQNIEITPAAQAWYGENFKSVRSGIMDATSSFMSGITDHPISDMFQDRIQAHEFMMQAWRHIWRHSLSTIKGIFTPAELSLIIDCHNAHMITPQMYGSNGLLNNVSDSMALDMTAEKWDVDRDKIKAKIEALTPIQSLCLELWSTGFWYGKNYGSQFEDYIKQLA